MGGWITHFRSTIPRNSVQPSLPRSRKRPAFNPKICDDATHAPRMSPYWRRPQAVEILINRPTAVLLLDRPEQPACLVEAHVVRPAVEGRKSLGSGTRAASTVGDTVRACAMPRHRDEERP